jgi:hypothetical protein
VQAQLVRWLAAISATDDIKQRVERAWQAGDDGTVDDSLLDRTVAALAEADPRAAEVLAAYRASADGPPQLFPGLREDSTEEFASCNLRLYSGRWLAQHAHFDEAAEQLAGLTPQQVVDPAALLFYQSVAQHRLLQKDECLKSLAKLFENESQLPRRYKSLARLMEADIKPLKTDSLDEVSRLMDDIRRRLDFGHAGQRVRKQEDDVIAKLDKMIKEMEQQQQQQRKQAMSDGQGGNRSSNPAQDSVPLPGRGPGDVDQKKIGNKSGWGDLPPKQREEALQQISKDLPAHFREVIEEYFRKLARDGGE